MSGGNQSRAHSALVNAACEALGQAPDLVVWKTNASAGGAPGAFFRGLPRGFSDLLILCAAPGGAVAIFAEAKTGAAKPSRNQASFQRVVQSVGGIYVVFRSVAELQLAIDYVRLKTAGRGAA